MDGGVLAAGGTAAAGGGVRGVCGDAWRSGALDAGGGLGGLLGGEEFGEGFRDFGDVRELDGDEAGGDL